MNANELTRKYGKQLTRELMDVMLIDEQLSGTVAQKLLVKHGVIKKSTKIIYVRLSAVDEYERQQDGRIGKTGNKIHKLYLNNGRNQTVLGFEFSSNEIHTILEMLSAE